MSNVTYYTKRQNLALKTCERLSGKGKNIMHSIRFYTIYLHHYDYVCQQLRLDRTIDDRGNQVADKLTQAMQQHRGRCNSILKVLLCCIYRALTASVIHSQSTGIEQLAKCSKQSYLNCITTLNGFASGHIASHCQLVLCN